MDRYLRLEQHEGETDVQPLHIRQVQGLQVLQQIREREWLRLRLLQVSELPVRFGEMHQGLPLAFDGVQSPYRLADGDVGDLPAAFRRVFRPEIRKERAGEGDDRSDGVHDFVCQDMHQLIPRFIFLAMQFAVERLPFVLGHQHVYAVEGGMQATLFPATDVFGEIEHRFVVLDGIQEKLYPPVRSVEIIDKETDQPRCDKEGHETQYDCPPRNDAGHAQARHQYDGDHLQKNAYV